MGTWWVYKNGGEKFLLLDTPEYGDGIQDYLLTENEVATLLLFLQDAQESWKRTPCMASPSA